MSDFDCIFADIDAWLVLLADGWRFANDVAQPMAGGHGEYSVYLWRAA